jgi:hypothetical protein
MAPSSGGLVPWLKIKDVHQPTKDNLEVLNDDRAKTVLRPVLAQGTEDDDKDDNRPKVSVQNLC